jgi:ribosomal protein L11
MGVKSSIKLFVPALEAKSGPPLAPILGQHQVNLMEFCKEFNKVTAGWAAGVPLPVKIQKLESNKFKLSVKSPTLCFLIAQAASGGTGGVDIVSVNALYDVLRFKSKFLCDNMRVDAKFLFGTLTSKRVLIQI